MFMVYFYPSEIFSGSVEVFYKEMTMENAPYTGSNLIFGREDIASIC